MKFFKKRTEQSPPGCGGCAVKTEGNCNSHLTKAAKVVVNAFVEAQIMFDLEDREHIATIADILAEDIRDDKNGHVAYEIPQDPKLRVWFLGLIRQSVTAGLTTNSI